MQSHAFETTTADVQPQEKWRSLLRQCRIGVWQAAASFALLLVIVFARAPMRQIPDALFVSDGFGYYIFLPSLIIDHDLSLANQLERVPYEAAKAYFDPVPKTGLRANPFPVGAPVLWLPFFLVGHATALVLQAFGIGAAPSGFGYVYELPSYCGAFFYALAGLWLLRRLIAELFSEDVGNLTLLAMLCCTPYAYYMWIEPDVSHSQAGFALALFLYASWRVMRDRDLSIVAWIGVGASAGLVALVRPYNGIVAVAVLPAALYVARARDAGLGRAAVCLGTAAVTAMVAFIPQVAIATVIYGQPTFLPPGTAYERMTWMQPKILSLLVSVFSYFPLLFVAVYGLVPRWRRPSADAVGADAGAGHEDATDAFLTWVRPAAFCGFLAVMYIVASYPRGSNYGDSFGQRRIADWVPILGVGFASWVASVRRDRWPTVVKAVFALAALGLVITALYTLKRLPEWGMAGMLG